MAAHYLGVYRDLDWVRVISFVDVNIESAQRAADTFPEDRRPLATTDYAAALAPDVDAVIISTPNNLHARQAIAAIEADKHVLLQKPVAASVADAEAIARAASGSGRTIGLYMSYFDQPLIHDLRAMTEAGALGDIVQCYAKLMHRGGMMWSKEAMEGRPTWRGSVPETGGGCFIQLAVHFIHIFEWMTGSKTVAAIAMTNRLNCPGIEGEDIASAILRLDSGALVTLDMAWCAECRVVQRPRGGLFGRRAVGVRRACGRGAGQRSDSAGVRRCVESAESAPRFSGSREARQACAGVD